MNTKLFVNRLSQSLDDIGLPALQAERIDAFSKLMKLPRFKAEAIINGKFVLDAALLNAIAQELEVSPEWLSGEQ